MWSDVYFGTAIAFNSCANVFFLDENYPLASVCMFWGVHLWIIKKKYIYKTNKCQLQIALIKQYIFKTFEILTYFKFLVNQMQTNIKYTPLNLLKAIMYECFQHNLTEIASLHLFLTGNTHTDDTDIGLFIMTWSCALYSSQSSQDVTSDTSVWISCYSPHSHIHCVPHKRKHIKHISNRFNLLSMKP